MRRHEFYGFPASRPFASSFYRRNHHGRDRRRRFEVGDGGDVEDGIRLGQRVVAGVVAERGLRRLPVRERTQTGAAARAGQRSRR